MSISIFEIFSIGIGPSSSHTVGPMKAAAQFRSLLINEDKLKQTKRLIVKLYGSLALTGKGHGTDIAILNGLEGQTPDKIDPKTAGPRVHEIRESKKLKLDKTLFIDFNEASDLLFLQTELLPLHSNGMHFFALDAQGQTLLDKIYYSIGGGFIVDDAGFHHDNDQEAQVPYPFTSAKDLLTQCEKNNLSIAQIMMQNEMTWRNEKEVRQGILHIAEVMKECIKSGCEPERILPGGLNIRRRAPNVYQKLLANDPATLKTKALALNWLSCYALAVNEENAAGGRVVTAPTNGAAGIIPAVLHYYLDFCEGNEEGTITFLLTAAAIAILYKKGASISAAEVGCQGEVGVACSMAAAALTAVLGGNLAQIENAAEIGMEHHLGLTCDPIAGLVQIPCIERNAMGAVQAVNTAQLALLEDGTHYVSLDKVIQTMLATGKDMQTRYKETSQGGLAVNLPEC